MAFLQFHNHILAITVKYMRSTHYNWRYHSLNLSSLKNVIDAKMNFMSNVTHLSNVTEKSPLNLETPVKQLNQIGIWGIWGSNNQVGLFVVFLKPFMSSFCGVSGHIVLLKQHFPYTGSTWAPWELPKKVRSEFHFFSGQQCNFTVHTDHLPCSPTNFITHICIMQHASALASAIDFSVSHTFI